ncbi:hypothetical protein LINPERPRIM_LOCUS658 [Linum perenne]
MMEVTSWGASQLIWTLIPL